MSKLISTFTTCAALTLMSVGVTRPAYADSSSSASLSDITLTLFSLNGGTPTISFSSGLNSQFVNFAADYTNNNVQENSANIYLADFSELATTVNAQASSSMTGTNSGANLPSSMSASSSATDNKGTLNKSYGTATYFPIFTLGSYTRAVFSAYGSTSATLGGSAGVGYGSFAGSQAIIQVCDISVQSCQNELFSSFVDAFSIPYPTFHNATDSGLLSVSFINDTSGTESGIFSAQANAYSFATPVPEPITYSMLLAGLGLIGFAARRRKQNLA